MEAEKFLRALEKLVGAPAETLRPETVIRSIAGLDSLRMVELIAMLDSDYGITIDYDAMAGCATLGDLLELAQAAQAGNAALA